jgi:hypothetical protein
VLVIRVQVAPPMGEPHGAALAGTLAAFVFDAIGSLALALSRLAHPAKSRQAHEPQGLTGF